MKHRKDSHQHLWRIYTLLPLFLFLFSAVWPFSSSARDFNTHWIAAPQSDSLSHIEFRRAFITEGKPKEVEITVATTGYYKLYVNECNVGTALYYPYRQQSDTTIRYNTFDITPYLRSDTNVVAILYSPTFPCKMSRQIAANIYGRSHDGTNFCTVSDGSWLCRRANSMITSDGGELIDGRQHDTTWKAATINNLALWEPAEEVAEEPNTGANTNTNDSETLYTLLYNTDINRADESLHIAHITPYQQDEVVTAEDYIILPYDIIGFLRATIREAKAGERIDISNLHYICNGTIDEQAYPRFAIGSISTIPFSGSRGFRPSHIMNLEAISVAPKRQPLW